MTTPRVGRALSDVPLVARDFQGHRAGIVTRVLAACVDFAIVVAVLLGMWVGWAALRFLLNPKAFSFPAPSLALVVTEGWIVSVFYLTVTWATMGRSYGDHVLALRVVNFRGNRMSWPGSFVRAGFCTLFPIGLGWILVSRHNRSIQDVALRTSVIYDWTVRPAPPGEPAAGEPSTG